MVGAEFLVELAPLLLGPAQFLDRRSQIEEVHRHDVGSRPQIGVADQGIELPTRLEDAGVDRTETFLLLGGVAEPILQGALLVRSGRL